MIYYRKQSYLCLINSFQCIYTIFYLSDKRRDIISKLFGWFSKVQDNHDILAKVVIICFVVYFFLITKSYLLVSNGVIKY